MLEIADTVEAVPPQGQKGGPQRGPSLLSLTTAQFLLAVQRQLQSEHVGHRREIVVEGGVQKCWLGSGLLTFS